MLHFLAYGNSDQASFRDLEVRQCFDILTVPSTIASYYSDATAAFVLSSQLDYMIEPRTPLFQEMLQAPRASHYTLAAEMGETVNAHLNKGGEVVDGNSRYFSPEFYSDDVCREMVTSMVDFQRQYGGRSAQITDKLNRYRKLLAEATGDSGTTERNDEKREPSYILCPYFAVRSFSDKWWKVVGRTWNAATQLDDPGVISPVVSMSDPSLLREAIEQVPSTLSSKVFFWIPGFDEKQASLHSLVQVRSVVADLNEEYDLFNLYGGYFSILLGKFGLAGFNNGLGYSESREWPTLDSTGAAPARYYVRKLHAYVSTATASAIVEADPAFACECSVCRGGRLPTELTYHELKRHFALARAWEIEIANSASLPDLRDTLRADSSRCDNLRNRLPSHLRIPTDHLNRWAEALDS
ncbi:MAG: hypothetical protein KTU85_01145 [Acidimicrobiia bacterium]|nr:hypothetical protein [Acidimicrobiia bacterium]